MIWAGCSFCCFPFFGNTCSAQCPSRPCCSTFESMPKPSSRTMMRKCFAEYSSSDFDLIRVRMAERICKRLAHDAISFVADEGMQLLRRAFHDDAIVFRLFIYKLLPNVRERNTKGEDGGTYPGSTSRAAYSLPGCVWLDHVESGLIVVTHSTDQQPCACVDYHPISTLRNLTLLFSSKSSHTPKALANFSPAVGAQRQPWVSKTANGANAESVRHVRPEPFQGSRKLVGGRLSQGCRCAPTAGLKLANAYSVN
jgi:hypothetical protein